MTNITTKPTQKRALITHARLIEAASAVISEKGYEALRVEEVVQRAGVAKGTFFTHFADKDALMNRLIGEEMNVLLEDLEKCKAPKNAQEIVTSLSPLLSFMTCEQYVFDIIMRYSGASSIENISHISQTFGRHGRLLSTWLENGNFRKDVNTSLLSEGVQAFSIQAMALNFCALHNNESIESRLLTYLKAWLNPAS